MQARTSPFRFRNLSRRWLGALSITEPRLANELANRFFRRILLVENDALCFWLVERKATWQHETNIRNVSKPAISLVARCVIFSVIGCLKRGSWTACAFSESILAARTNQSCWSWRNQQPINVFGGRCLGTMIERVIWTTTTPRKTNAGNVSKTMIS